MLYIQAIIYIAVIAAVMGLIFWLVTLAPAKIIIGMFVCFLIWYIKIGIDIGIVPKLWGKNDQRP